MIHPYLWRACENKYIVVITVPPYFLPTFFLLCVILLYRKLVAYINVDMLYAFHSCIDY